MYLPSVFKERLLHRLFQFMIIATYCEKRYMLEGQTGMKFVYRPLRDRQQGVFHSKPAFGQWKTPWVLIGKRRPCRPLPPTGPCPPTDGKVLTRAVSQHKTAGPRNSPRLRRFLLRTSLKYMRDNKRSTLSYKAGLPALLMTVSFRLHRNSKSQNSPMAVSLRLLRQQSVPDSFSDSQSQTPSIG